MNRWVAPLILTAAYAAALTMVVDSVVPRVAYAQQQDVIRNVQVEGTQRIEPATVLSYLTLKAGDPFDQAQLDISLKNLFATGLFADVTLRQDRDRGILIVTVAENPIINRIAFEGNKKLETSKLTDEIQLKPRTVYTRTRVQADVDRILELYRRAGRYSAQVAPKAVVLDQNRVDLVFEVDEGPRTPVSRINFVGNHAFDGDALRDEVLTKESAWWRFLTSNDSYDPDRLQYDRELLRRFYLANGYADFRVVSAVAELTPDRQEFFITFTIDEGERYDFGKIDLRSELKGLDTAPLTDFVTSIQGDVYDASKIDDTVVALSTAITNQHYAFVDVRPEFTKNRAAKTIDIVYDISEGPRVFVERINISGNDRTIDEVIRRQIKLSEGDAFNQALMKKSEQSIKDLDYFDNEKVKLTNVPGSEPDKTIINVDVIEKSTGSISIGGGYSGLDGAFAQFSIGEANLLGEGKAAQFAATISSYYTTFDISYAQPYLLGRDINAGFDLIRSEQAFTDYASYDQTRTGIDFHFNYPISDVLRQTVTYSFTANQVTNIQPYASLFVFEEQGLRYTSQIGQTLIYDRRDSKVDPTKGYTLRGTTNLAGLGGTDRYFQIIAGGGVYFKLADGYILNIRGEAGDTIGIGQLVPIEARQFIGGNNGLRGFKNAGVGPRDKNTNDPLGGDYYYTGTFETSIPLGLPKEYGIKMYAFSDFGAVGGIDVKTQTFNVNGVPTTVSPSSIFQDFALRASAGIGFSWKSPFGPIRIDIAEPFLKQSYDKGHILNFDFGGHF